MSIFTTRGGHDPKIRGTVGSGLSRQFHRYLKILNPIIFGHLAAVLANVHNDDANRRTLHDVETSWNFVPDV